MRKKKVLLISCYGKIEICPKRRWSSPTYPRGTKPVGQWVLMIERILLTKTTLLTILLGTAKAPSPFTAEEINALEELCQLLWPLKKQRKKYQVESLPPCRSWYSWYGKCLWKFPSSKIYLKPKKLLPHLTLKVASSRSVSDIMKRGQFRE